MTNSTSKAYLPAPRVKKACDSALRDIDLSRKRVMRAVITQFKIPRPHLWLRKAASVYDKMPPELKEIVRLHRAEERAAVVQLLDLSGAAADLGADISVEVSAPDFALIKNHFSKKGET